MNLEDDKMSLIYSRLTSIDNYEANESLYCKIAEHVFKIHYNGREVKEGLVNYVCDIDRIDKEIWVTIEDLESECKNLKLPPISMDDMDIGLTFTSQSIESLCIQHKIADYLIAHGIILVHGVAIAVNENCVVLLADSGVGKTTHALNWIRAIPGARVINGDKPFIDVSRMQVYGSPWCGKEGMNENVSARLLSLVSLNRSDENHISSISFSEMFPKLMAQCYLPKDLILTSKTLKMIGMLNGIPCYNLECNKSSSSAVLAYNAVFNGLL